MVITQGAAIVVSEPVATLAAPVEDRSGAATDAGLVQLWLEGKRSAHTRRAYARDVAAFLDSLAASGRSLRTATVADASGFVNRLVGVPLYFFAQLLIIEGWCASSLLPAAT